MERVGGSWVETGQGGGTGAETGHGAGQGGITCVLQTQFSSLVPYWYYLFSSTNRAENYLIWLVGCFGALRPFETVFQSISGSLF